MYQFTVKLSNEIVSVEISKTRQATDGQLLEFIGGMVEDARQELEGYSNVTVESISVRRVDTTPFETTDTLYFKERRLMENRREITPNVGD